MPTRPANALGLESELRSAHLDQLTGAYRREMGRMALSHEIDRARRSDGRFVLAFVDVDRLKLVNDRDGHAAGDRILQAVVRVIRARLRSFDPIVRYGGDEFVCGLTGTDLPEAERRFEAVDERDRGGDRRRHQRRVRRARDRRHRRSADRAGRRGDAPGQVPAPRIGPGRRQPPVSDATSWSSWSGVNSPVRRPATFPSAPIATQYGNAVRP